MYDTVSNCQASNRTGVIKSMARFSQCAMTDPSSRTNFDCNSHGDTILSFYDSADLTCSGTVMQSVTKPACEQNRKCGPHTPLPPFPPSSSTVLCLTHNCRVFPENYLFAAFSDSPESCHADESQEAARVVSMRGNFDKFSRVLSGLFDLRVLGPLQKVHARIKLFNNVTHAKFKLGRFALTSILASVEQTLVQIDVVLPPEVDIDAFNSVRLTFLTLPPKSVVGCTTFLYELLPAPANRALP